MTGQNLGPIPSRLVFLSDLPRAASGDKVRFLGCVTHYSVAAGALSMQHSYPAPAAGSRSRCVTAVVDVRLLLDSLKSSDAQVGEWLNVIGYVSAAERVGLAQLGTAGNSVGVQAVMLWPAGPFNLGEYEMVLKGRLEFEASKS
ncbi:MAG: hypothetical protein M1829_002246 [Trizodia sp. TS-e1964]|nr:MAG: hypothetical protein M1829_002246 [Trizodia sp. TS-e1964]